MSMKKIPISERRATYPLEHRLKSYSPEKIQRQLTDATAKKLVLNGVNILNNRSLDCDTAKDRILQRRETHNKVERRRRDIMNALIGELSDIVPTGSDLKTKSQRASVLRRAVQYIRWIQTENQQLRGQLNLPEPPVPELQFDDQDEHTSHTSRSPSVESGTTSDTGEDSRTVEIRSDPRGTFHTFSLSNDIEIQEGL
ncbi:hypothetical protein INT43_003200 [Umbelopsis isabellina]|uniref:BHLH domain-containing protein n=1 Tax=Mortierella isabellina TaxID=91625 RepID=A0A8H7UFH1_MORIS|nr:hypothetical protein INT43_003200 [Umbelopsis isabellina]